LVTAVAPVVIDCGGLWIGWSGLHTKEPLEYIPESDPDDKAPTAGLLSKQVSRQTTCFVCVIFEEHCRCLKLFLLF